MSNLRMLDSPSRGSSVKDKFSIQRGGLGTETSSEAASLLNAVLLSQIDGESGIAGLDNQGNLKSELLSFNDIGSIAVAGPNTVSMGSVNRYLITNFDSFTEYTVQAIDGGVEIHEDEITYYAPNEVKATGFIVNGREYTVNVVGAVPDAPTVTVTQAAGTPYTVNVSLFGTPFTVSGGGALHQSTDWQIASDAAFTNIVRQSMADSTNKLSWTATSLTELTNFHARVRYRDSFGGVSAWSNTVSFQTIRVTPNAPVIQTLTLNSSIYMVAGQSAPFTVTLTAGSQGPFTYRWTAFVDGVLTVLRTVTTASLSDSLSVDIDDYPDAFIQVTAENVGGVSSPQGLNIYQVTANPPFVVAKNAYGNPESNQSLGTITHFAQYWIGGGGSQNALFINTLWPNGTGQDPYLKFRYVYNGADVNLANDASFYSRITDIKFIIDGVEYTGGVQPAVAASYIHLEPGLGNAIAQLYNLANNGKTVTVSYRFNGSAPIQRSFTLQVLEAPIPTALEWSSGTNTGTTYGQLSVSSGLNYILRGNINTANRALVSNMQIVSGSLPPGMNLNGISSYNNFRPSGSPAFNSSSHSITNGNPTTPGTYNFTVRLTWRAGDTNTPFTDYPVTITVVA